MRILKQTHFWVIFTFDVALLAMCYLGACWVCLNGRSDASVMQQFAGTFLPLLACKMVCFFLYDLYRGMWRYTSINDLVNVIKASVCGSLLAMVCWTLLDRFSGNFRAIALVDAVFTVVAIGGCRLLVRIYFQQNYDLLSDIKFWRRTVNSGRKALIVGTGCLAERLLREISDASKLNYTVIGFVDEGKTHDGMKIHGVPILGALPDIPNLIDYYRIDDILIAVADTENKMIKMLVESCAGFDVRFKVIPSLQERIDANVAKNLRDIKLEDLLERDSVRLNMDLVRQDIQGKTVLVTGAGGSIGSELSRQIFEFNPKQLILLDNAETPLYSIDLELNKKDSETKVVPCIGDVRSTIGLDRIFTRYKPNIVYHAAAYKHVPMMELSPVDAVHNNVLGTFNVARAANKHHVTKFVMISTDKAVRPTSVMGATKRVAEMAVQSMNGNGTQFSVVRFGNVLGSNGSVVPLFEKQIASGGPVTVTHPEITRYFMTIPEAVMLVLQSGAIGRGGDLFLLDMGEPVKIVDLAKNMIRLAGLVPDVDVAIEYVGMRPGEKLYEELLIEGEDVVDTSYEKIKICLGENNIDKAALLNSIESLDLLVQGSGDEKAVRALINKIVPRYRCAGADDKRSKSTFKLLQLKSMAGGKKEVEKIGG